jgi:hypothetical protein
MKTLKHTIIILLLAGILLPATTGCKKDNGAAAATTCNRLDKSSTYSESDKLRQYSYEYNADGTIKAVSGTVAPSYTYKYVYTYENGGRLITEQNANNAADKTVFELNADGYISHLDYAITNGVRKDNYTYDANGFLNTITYEYYKTGATTPFSKIFISYENTIDNGNRVKTIETYKDVTANKTNPPTVYSFEYDLTKSTYMDVPTPYTDGGLYWYIGKGYQKKSKNLLIKYSSTYAIGQKFQFSYTADSKGRLSEVITTDVSGNPGASNNGKSTYTYQCN